MAAQPQAVRPAEDSTWDVVIVGAGPAGLSAALILGRCCRRVLIVDRGTPRSWASHAIHAFLSRDGINPSEFREVSREELAQYPNVEFRPVEAHSARRSGEREFTVGFADGTEARARKLLLATGLTDELPPLKGIEAFFGRSVFPCPYCDGWELRDAPLAVYGRKQRGFEMARALTAWSRDVVLCSDGPAGLSAGQRKALADNEIAVESARIAELCGRDGQLESIRFEDGRELSRRAMFFDTPTQAQSSLARQLGCQFTTAGGIKCGKYEASSVPGVFVAGNILRDVQLSIVAAAEGARAAFGINRALTREDFERSTSGRKIIEHDGPA